MKTNNNPLISVVIPVYNPDDSFSETITSVLNQTYPLFEVIVVDDGSEIPVAPIIEKLNDSRVSYYKLEHKNANVARNYGILEAKGEFIAMLDSDDLWLENHLEDCVNTIRETNTDGLYGSLIIRNKQTSQDRQAIVREIGSDETTINYLLTTGYGAQSSTLFLTAESAKAILWDAELNRHQDYDFVVRYTKQYKLAPKKNPTVIYVAGGKVSKIDFNSCIRFIKRNDDDINPQLYNIYHFNMLSLAHRLEASDKIMNHYKIEATRYKQYLSYQKFLSIRYPKTKMERFKCKVEYLFHISRVGIE